ncbi:MAG: M24 family metallopeptidase [Spirochaetaceae bacterium]|jgi:Xaa-Pro dipeptidase|nr:M24 family metallopeptidase [Spirochaetaceae bacterium]
MNTYEKRRAALYDWMSREHIDLIMFEDAEGRRDSTVRWLSGHPSDAALFLSAGRRSLLMPWDIHISARYRDADQVIPYTDFERSPFKALRAAAEIFTLPAGSKVEVPPASPYPMVLRYKEVLGGFTILCRDSGAHHEAARARAVKDPGEIGLYRRVAAITNDIIARIEEEAGSGRIAVEQDAALFIEAACRDLGCEGTGFETIAAGPGRSGAIHAFPGYTKEAFAGAGLSILDFGLKYQGYTSDVTLTFARAPLTEAQEQMVSLTEKAYGLALGLVRDGAFARDIGAAAHDFLRGAGQQLVHGLGHGIGLDVHEFPSFSIRPDNDCALCTGMVFALEPGIYDPVQGGCRLENDILLTENGAEVLTRARIIRLPAAQP